MENADTLVELKILQIYYWLLFCMLVYVVRSCISEALVRIDVITTKSRQFFTHLSEGLILCSNFY